MSNGYMYVAPRQQGKSFSDMVDEQKAIIQAQQRENIANQVASQRQRAAFQYKQLEKSYGFDVNGWSQDLIDAFKTRQDDISNKLKTGEYDDVTTLIQDVGELTSLHGMGSSDAAMNKQGEDDYLGWETGSKEWTQEGTEFIGDATDRQNRNSHTRGGGRLQGSRVVGGRVVGMYVDVNGRTMEDVMLESDPTLQRQEDEAGNVFLVGEDGNKTQVGGDAFSNPFVGNQANWAPSSRPLGDIAVDAFSVDLHKNAIANLRGKENMTTQQKEEALAGTLNLAFNGGSKTVDRRRLENSAIAYWEQQAGGEISWNGEAVESLNDGLTPQELFVRDSVRFADLDQKATPTAPAPMKTPAETAMRDVVRISVPAPDMSGPQDPGADLDPSSSSTVIGQIPLGTNKVKWGTESSGGVVSVQAVMVAGNGDIVIQYLPDDASTDPFGLQSTESNTGEGRILRIPMGQQDDFREFNTLQAAINQAFPTRTDEDNFFKQAYRRLMGLEGR